MVVLSLMSLPVTEMAQIASLVLTAGAPVWNFLQPRLQASGTHMAEAAYDKLSEKVGGWLGTCFGPKDVATEAPPELVASALQPQLEQDPQKSEAVNDLLMQLVNQNTELLKALLAEHTCNTHAFAGQAQVGQTLVAQSFSGQPLVDPSLLAATMAHGQTLIGDVHIHGEVGKLITVGGNMTMTSMA